MPVNKEHHWLVFTSLFVKLRSIYMLFKLEMNAVSFNHTKTVDIWYSMLRSTDTRVSKTKKL